MMMMGVVGGIVVLKLLCFHDFYENGLKMEKFDFDEFKWIDDVVELS